MTRLNNLRTPADEERRYKAVSEQITQLLDTAANDRSPGGMVGLGSVWLAAELYDKNETAHTAYYARTELLGLLQWRAKHLPPTIERYREQKESERQP